MVIDPLWLTQLLRVLKVRSMYKKIKIAERNQPGFIGVGEMGSLLLKRILNRPQNKPLQIRAWNRSPEKLKPFTDDIIIEKSWQDVADRCDTLFICIPWKGVTEILNYMRRKGYREKHCIIIAMGIELKVLDNLVTLPFTRLLPSVLLECEQIELIVCHNSHVEVKHRNTLVNLLGSQITLREVAEGDFEHFSKLLSCGPALIGEFLRQYPAAVGFKESYEEGFLERLFYQTVKMTIEVAEKSGLSMKEIQKKVCTPGGASERGVKVLSERLPDILKDSFKEMQNANDMRKHSFRETVSSLTEKS